jgi:hypothetical protein
MRARLCALFKHVSFFCWCFMRCFMLREGNNAIRFSHRWRGYMERVHAGFPSGLHGDKYAADAVDEKRSFINHPLMRPRRKPARSSAIFHGIIAIPFRPFWPHARFSIKIHRSCCSKARGKNEGRNFNRYSERSSFQRKRWTVNKSITISSLLARGRETANYLRIYEGIGDTGN